MDDAVGLVLFAVSFGVAQALQSGAMDIISILVNPLVEIVGSLILGSVMGLLLTLLERMFFSNSNRLSLTIAFVFMTISLSAMKFHVGPVHIGFSNLLVCMMLGTIFCNMCPRSPVRPVLCAQRRRAGTERLLQHGCCWHRFDVYPCPFCR